MRTDTIRTYKSVHTWTGILTGLFLFVAFYAGTLTVFEPSLSRWAAPPAPSLTPQDRADTLIADALVTLPETRRHFTLHLDGAETLPARLTYRSSPDATAPVGVDLPAEEGQPLRTAPLRNGDLGQFIDDLHRTAGLTGDAELGSAFMGVVSALYAVALISGLIVLLPSLIKDLLVLRIGPNLKRLWLDAHNLVGLVSLPFHLLIALTSVVFGLHDVIYDTLDTVIYDGKLRATFMAENPYAAIPPNPAPAPLLPVADLLIRVQETAPGFTPAALEYRDAGTSGATVTVRGTDDRYLMRGEGFLVLSAVTGETANVEYMPGLQNAYGATLAAFFALHFASFGGPSVKAAYLLLGFGGAFLFWSGNLLWIESRRRHEKRATGLPDQRRSTRWMANLTVGVCLGCVIGVSATIAASKGLALVIDPSADLSGEWMGQWIGNWHRPLYLCCLLLSVLWAFGRGASRAMVPLLWIAAGLTAAIPALSVLAWLAPGLGIWVWSETVGVDLMAGGGVIAYAGMARLTARRARSTPRDSVWALPRTDANPSL